MTIAAIVKGVNDALAGELLSYIELKPFLDETIDDINNLLDATFPSFSDLTGLEEVIRSSSDPFIQALDEHAISLLANTYYISNNENKFISAFITAVQRQCFKTDEFKAIQQDTAALTLKARALWEAAHIEVNEYDFFPDRYIRSVVIKGAAYKFYIMDEEGIPTAQQYGIDYENALFLMLRDYLEDVPPKYKAHNQASVKYVEDIAFIPGWWRSTQL